MNFKIKKIILIFLFLLYLFSSTPVLGDPGNNRVSSHAQHQMTPTLSYQKTSNSYTPHDPINVIGNANFKTEGFTGNGTIDDPYIFENYIIANDTAPLITIQKTDAYFIIRNNFLDGIDKVRGGISLTNASNGVIENNTVVNAIRGIYIGSSGINPSNITVTDNTFKNNEGGISGGSFYNCNYTNNKIFDNTENGISFSGCSGNIISNNTIHDNGKYGIYIKNSTDTLVMNNSIANNKAGIFISTGERITIYNNTIMGHIGQGFAGIGVGVNLGSSSSNLTSNTILNNTKGIDLYGIDPSNVSKNIVVHNNYSIYIGSPAKHSITENIFYYSGTKDVAGIDLGPGTTSYFKWNDFIGNVLSRDDCQVYPRVGSYFSENYWDDWTCPDADTDGIVDIPYPIPPGELTDASPLTSPHNDIPVNLHLLSRPRLLYPKYSYATLREELKGTITVKWCSVTDFSGHNVSYTLYYSTKWNESETVWEELATDLTTPEYEWDTTSIEIEHSCVMKVVAVCSEGLASEYLLINDEFKIDNRTTAADTDGWSFSILALTLCLLVVASRRKKSKYAIIQT